MSRIAASRSDGVMISLFFMFTLSIPNRPSTKAAESATKAAADPTSAELKADAVRMSKRSKSTEAPDFVDAGTMRSEWT